MSESMLEELQRYVGFGAEDRARLNALGPDLAPWFPEISDIFYARIREFPAARAVLEHGESSLGRLKELMVHWMADMFRGPWDLAYFERRSYLGRIHVRIGLPQHYFFGAMAVIRFELNRRIERVREGRDILLSRDTVSRALDIETAQILNVYRVDLEAQKARFQRLSESGAMLSGVLHDLRNPLGVAHSSLYLIQQKAGSHPDVQKHVSRIGDQLRLLDGLVSTLLDYVHERPVEREKARVAEMFDSVLASIARPDGVAVHLEEPTPTLLVGEPRQLRQMLLNLVQNGVEAVGERGIVRVRSRPLGEGKVELVVEDTGPGLDPDIRARLFTPLLTTKTRGIGLGLAMVRRIVDRHGGAIAYAPERGSGARFVMELPGLPADPPAP